MNCLLLILVQDVEYSICPVRVVLGHWSLSVIRWPGHAVWLCSFISVFSPFVAVTQFKCIQLKQLHILPCMHFLGLHSKPVHV